MPPKIKDCIHDINMYDSNYLMGFSTPIHSVESNTNNIYLGGNIWDELTYECYNDKNDTFGLLFQQYIPIVVENIYHPF